jgi:hypothetical protein
MAKYLDTQNRYGGIADHAEEILALHTMTQEFMRRSTEAQDAGDHDTAKAVHREAVIFKAATELLVCHDETGHNLTAASCPGWLALVEDCLERLGFEPHHTDLDGVPVYVLTNGA